MKVTEKSGGSLTSRLAMVVFVALGVAGTVLLAGLGLLKWLIATHVVTLSPGDDTMVLAGVAGIALALFTVTLVLGGLTATRMDRMEKK